MTSDEPVAIFIDTENLTHWVKSGQLSAFMGELEGLGQIQVRKAYARWSLPSAAPHQAALNQLGFDLVHTYHPVSRKNSADIHMTVDVMQQAARKDLHRIVLATGDSDFSPLFRRLREMGKQVIGIGPRSPLSEAVESSCSRFVYVDMEKSPAAGTKKRKPTGGTKAGGASLTLERATALLKATLKAVDGPANCSGLKSRMLATDSAFDEKQLGFKRFRDFVKAVPGVVLKQESNLDYASLEAAEKTPLPVGRAFAPPAPAKDDARTRTESYRRILRRKHWHSPPPESFCRVVEALGAPSPPPMPLTEIRTRVVQLCEGQVTATDVKRAVELFHKIGLSQYAGQNEAEKSLWRVPPVTAHDARHAADVGMLIRLLAGLKEQALPFDTAHVTPLLMDRYDDEALAALVANARGQAMSSALDAN